MAKFRGRLPRKGPLPFRYVFLLTFVFFMFSTAAGLWIINDGIKPTLRSYAETQTRRIATLVINKAINKEIAKGMGNNPVIVPNQGSDSQIILNNEMINRIAGETVYMIERNLKQAEKGYLEDLQTLTDLEIETGEKKQEGIVYYVPLGQATNNALLGNLGPKIPIRFQAIGNVGYDIKTKFEEFGINNTAIKVVLHLVVDVQIILPFSTNVTTITQDIPIVTVYEKGDVPNFYNGGRNSTSPSIQMPGN
ncbi:sporulation protein YunB [Bacillus methanolicus]|uniref:Sporulation protein YunB n=1 Tax=Bacillus methanolicus (strain MGA3 / ATCC 53907) TaxID=796606 RepID=I3DUH8_BACMM|nr:sporulation protein YunB [Bacillus methanolicus]AIE61220.1 sporulation protein YunB [Bacillus methanolicus MGA3]EIJ77899.1 sporulation protein YunB [Bacillus methanolicus MGA3]UQD53211.1 sporulation protein YunB [Bacillus methanolicus]